MKYKIGNCLRGYVGFKARSDKEAWAKGTKRITSILKEGKKGITVYLQREVAVRVTPGMAQRLKETGQSPPTDWITVLAGSSSDPWPEE